MNKDNIDNKIKWAINYIQEYNKNNTFSPFYFVDDPIKQRKQKIYIECVDFLQTLEELTAAHEKRLKNYL